MLIQTWQPWTNSTGPRTNKGKATASQNAFKGGVRPLIRQLGRLLREQEDALDGLSTEDYDSMAETVVGAALQGNPWAIQEIGKALDE
jgi:hypothetical protein